MKVLVFGAGGVVGQHMMHQAPEEVEPIYTRTLGDDRYCKFIYGEDSINEFLDFHRPNLIINLAGENRVDIVESSPERFYDINVLMPSEIVEWCNRNQSYLIQCSTQAVFSGNNPPYSPLDPVDPINKYGEQKSKAEDIVLKYSKSLVARLTFVLGARYFTEIGRRNPFEDIMEKDNQLQVDDRFFSPLFAHDAASSLWDLSLNYLNWSKKIVHLGHPTRCTRFSIASDTKYHLHGILDAKIMGVSHEYFSGLAQRAYDTTWAYEDCMYSGKYEENLLTAFTIWSKINDKDRR